MGLGSNNEVSRRREDLGMGVDVAISVELRERVLQLFRPLSKLFTLRFVRDTDDLPDTASDDIDLVILPVDVEYAAVGHAEKHAEDILAHAGENDRRYRNRAIFAPPAANLVRSVRACAEQFVTRGPISAQEERRISDALDRAVKEAYTTLLVPEMLDESSCLLRPVTPRAGRLEKAESTLHALRDEDAVIDVWDPISLLEHLEEHYFKRGQPEVTLGQVWDDLCRYCYMERLLNRSVLLESANQGVEMGLFGCALEKTNKGPQNPGVEVVSPLSANTLFVSRERAEEYRDDERRQKQEALGRSLDKIASAGWGSVPEAKAAAGSIRLQAALRPENPVADLTKIQNDILPLLRGGTGREIRVSVEIEARGGDFDPRMFWTAREKIARIKETFPIDIHLDVLLDDEKAVK